MTSPLFRAAPSNPRQVAALSMQALGLSVVPWAHGPKGKVPTKLWQVGVVPVMTSDEIRYWWLTHSADNVGVITGPTAGNDKPGMTDIIGIDLDTPSALEWAQANLQPTPWRTRTGRDGGGQHWVYRQPPLEEGWYIKNTKSSPVAGLDVRGGGGYIAVPPSVHASGRSYEWISRPTSIEEIPYLDLSIFPPTQRKVAEVSEGVDVPESIVQQAKEWLQLQPIAVQGERGGDQSFSVAASLTRGFALSPQQTLDVIADWNAQCLPPWEHNDLIRLIDRSYTEGHEPIGSRTAALAVAAVMSTWQKAPVKDPTEETAALHALYSEPSPFEAEGPKVDLSAARDIALTLPADARSDTGAPFTDSVLQAAATLKREDLPGFIRMRQELKSIGSIPMAAWDRAVSKAGSPVRSKERIEASRLCDGDRVRVVMTGDDKALCDDILDALSKAPSIYAQSKNLCYLAGDVLTPLDGDRLHNAVLQLVNVVKGTADKGTGDVVMTSVSIPKHIIGLLSNLLPEQREKFRQVDQVLRFPFCAADDAGAPYLVTDVGYNAASRTVLVSTGSVSLDRFTSAAEALAYLKWLIADFPFVSVSERDNYLGLLVQLVARPFIDGNTPLYILEGNQENVGKSLLAKLPLLLSGCVPAKLLPWPDKGPEEAIKSLPTSLERAEAVVAWDNARGNIASTTLEALFTSRAVTLRYLGTSRVGDFIIKQLWLMTSNNVETNRDGARRAVRIRLVKTDWSRENQIKDFETYCTNNRGEILSAILHLINHWIQQGAEIKKDLPSLDSYETWAGVVGSILHANGVTAWMLNKAEAKSAMTSSDDWDAFTTAWWDKYHGEKVTAAQLFQLCQTTGLHAELLGDGNDKAQVTRMGMALRKKNQAVFTSASTALQIVLLPQRANATAYKLSNLSLTPAHIAGSLQLAS